MRTAIMSIATLVLFFGMWQFLASNPNTSSPISPSVPPMPTPFTQTAQVTSPTTTLENCEMSLYNVQDGDTLTSIAAQFLVAEDEIVSLNHLQTDALHPSMELIIPVCNSTPTGTVHPATFTTTYTPNAGGTTSTPADKY